MSYKTNTGKKKKMLVASITLLIALYSCSGPHSTPEENSDRPDISVLTLIDQSATTYREFPAALEGKNNVEIHAQVEGYLDAIYVEEGAFVKQGQPLFKIDSRIFNERMKSSQADLEVASANVSKAKIEVERLQNLVSANIVSDIQLKTAKANYTAAVALVSQARASLENAKINLGFTTISAPVSGYIGRIPYKKGSLISAASAAPLTTLSDISQIYAYFSMSELDYIQFQNKYTGNTDDDKLKNLPEVSLVLADNSLYNEKGNITMVNGQFDNTTGAISMRAVFPNQHARLKTGNTGRIRLPQFLSHTVQVPQEATFSIQDKYYAYVVDKKDRVQSRQIAISGKTESSYFISDGLKAGDVIAVEGVESLKDGTIIHPIRKSNTKK